jgi:hypothetical protein
MSITWLDGYGLLISGWWLTSPSEKSWSSSVGMMTFPTYGKIENVPNHQPDKDVSISSIFNIGCNGIWNVMEYEWDVNNQNTWYIDGIWEYIKESYHGNTINNDKDVMEYE